MLNQLEKTREAVAGRSHAIDMWLNARQDLLIQYVSLISRKNGRQKCLPSGSLLEYGFVTSLIYTTIYF